MMTDTTATHFPVMILASVLLFLGLIRLVQSPEEYRAHLNTIIGLALLVVVLGMCIGKYGAGLGWPWWIYYPAPMLMTVLLPPLALRLNRRRTALYLALSLLSAPFIHAFFSFFLGWGEYMPFWQIPAMGDL